jgi:hypothetical protein
MRLKAYILLADPAWIEHSILSYYDAVDEIVVSYDKESRGWTGRPVIVDECLRRLKAIDRDGKMRYFPGDYYSPKRDAMQSDTYQRQCALDQAGTDADWILQLDTDEVLPDVGKFIESLEYAAERGIPAVEWPMRVFFQRLPDGRFLEICESQVDGHFEYPGPIAVRPGTKLASARRTAGPYVRAVVEGDRSLQTNRPAEANEHRVTFCSDAEAIAHFSWVRTPAEVRSKIASWGHSEGWKTWFFYQLYWRSAPRFWRWHRDFHPFARGLWKALRPAAVPFATKSAHLATETAHL